MASERISDMARAYVKDMIGDAPACNDSYCPSCGTNQKHVTQQTVIVAQAAFAAGAEAGTRRAVVLRQEEDAQTFEAYWLSGGHWGSTPKEVARLAWNAALTLSQQENNNEL